MSDALVQSFVFSVGSIVNLSLIQSNYKVFEYTNISIISSGYTCRLETAAAMSPQGTCSHI